MEEEYKNKNRFATLPQFICFVVLIFAFIYVGNISFDNYENDAEKFSNEFVTVSKDNVFVYASAKDILNTIDENVMVLFGSSQNEYTEYYAKLINDVAKEMNIEKILYYDFFADRMNNNGTYEVIVNEISGYLLTDDMGNTEIYAPTFLVIKNGVIEYINEDVNFIKGSMLPEDYWSENNTEIFKATLRAVFTTYNGEN